MYKQGMPCLYIIHALSVHYYHALSVHFQIRCLIFYIAECDKWIFI